VKKLLALILALALTACCALAEGVSAGLPGAAGSADTDTGVNYLTAKVVVEPWPELPENGMPIFYEEDKCLVLPRPGETFAPFLYDTGTGKATYLYYYEEELPVWKDMVMENMSYLGYTEEQVEEFCGGYYVDYYFHIISGQDILTSVNIIPGEIVVNFMYASFVIDTRMQVISPAQDGIMMGGGVSITWLNSPDPNYIYRAADGAETAVTITGDPGYEYNPYTIDFEWDAVAMTVGAKKKSGGNASFAMGFAEGYTSGEMVFTDLGAYAASGGPIRCRLCGNDAALAYNEGALTVYPTLIVRRGSPEAQALIWDGTAMTAVNVSELTGESGAVSMKGYDYRYLYPLDVSADGRYAALVDGSTGDLLVMDTVTLETRIMLTGAELTEMGCGSLIEDMAGWFSGDTILGKNGYHLRFVFE